MPTHTGNSYITRQEQICQPPDTVTCISPSRVFVLHTNFLGARDRDQKPPLLVISEDLEGSSNPRPCNSIPSEVLILM